MAKLIVRFESKIIQELELDPAQEYMAGRDDTCQIPLKGKSGISRNHFKVYFNGSQWQIDVISKFGHLNFQAQEVNSIVLESGNSFSLAPFDFQFLEAQTPVPAMHTPPTNEVTDSPNLPAPIDSDTLALEGNVNHLPAPVSPTPAPAPTTPSDDYQGDDEKTIIGASIGEPVIQIFNRAGEDLGSFQLQGGNLWTIGRDDACDIKLPEPKASRKHFEISRVVNGFVLTDLGSSNGTKLNGRKISPSSSVTLNSGDTISVANLKIRFEIKNAAIAQQVKNLPDVLFKQAVVASPLSSIADYSGESGDEGGPARRLSLGVGVGLNLNPKLLVIGALFLLIIYVLTSEVKDPNTEKPDKTIEIVDRPINKLTPEQQQTVKENYASAQSLIQRGSFQLAKSELDKIHALIPFYERSKDLEAQCDNALRIVEEINQQEAEKKKFEETQRRVLEVVNNCKSRFNSNTTLEEINQCMVDAINLDPANTEVAALQEQAKKQDDARTLTAQNKAEYEENVRKGKEAFGKAERLRKNQELFAALKAYENYRKSNYPDPDNNKASADRMIATLRSEIDQRIDKLLRDAIDMLGKEDFKGALMAISTAKKVNPNEEKIADTESKVTVVQNKKLLDIYRDAKFEESLGNVQVTKEKCQKIIELSLPDNEFYGKCRLLLKKYGF